MQSHEVQPEENAQPETESGDKEKVSSAMGIAEDTEDVTEESFAKNSANQEFRTPCVDHTSAQSKRVNPDSRIFIRVVIGGVIIAGFVAFAISFVSLYSVAEWLGLPSWMWWAVPTFIDLAILVYASLVLVHRARGEKTWPSWVALGAFTVLSVIANGAHALSHEHDTQWQAYIGVLIAAMVPIAIFVATEQLSRVAIEDLNSRKSEMKDQLELEQFEAEQRQKREELAFEAEQRQWDREKQRIQAQRQTEMAQQHHEIELDQMQSAKHNVAIPNGRNGVGESMKAAQTVAVAPQSKATSSNGHDALITYLRDQVASGYEITGSLVAEFLGVSDRTGRRRIKELEEQHPELFTSQAAEVSSATAAEPHAGLDSATV